MVKRLVLLDIDGTLIWSDGIGRASMKPAATELYGSEMAERLVDYEMGGRTIKDIMDIAFAESGIAPDSVEPINGQFAQLMAQAMKRLLQEGQFDVRPCPGGHELVARLAAHPDAMVGLLTGNVRETSMIKLAAAGYDTSLFEMGSYGDISAHRADLVTNALEIASAQNGTTFTSQQAVVIGDTVRDAECAREAGARSLIVTTGGYDQPTLETANPDFLFTDLSDTDAVMIAIFSEAAAN
jgi:phosphoglycolate phosphatase